MLQNLMSFYVFGCQVTSPSVAIDATISSRSCSHATNKHTFIYRFITFLGWFPGDGGFTPDNKTSSLFSLLHQFELQQLPSYTVIGISCRIAAMDTVNYILCIYWSLVFFLFHLFFLLISTFLPKELLLFIDFSFFLFYLIFCRSNGNGPSQDVVRPLNGMPTKRGNCNEIIKINTAIYIVLQFKCDVFVWCLFSIRTLRSRVYTETFIIYIFRFYFIF